MNQHLFKIVATSGCLDDLKKYQKYRDTYHRVISQLSYDPQDSARHCVRGMKGSQHQVFESTVSKDLRLCWSYGDHIGETVIILWALWTHDHIFRRVKSITGDQFYEVKFDQAESEVCKTPIGDPNMKWGGVRTPCFYHLIQMNETWVGQSLVLSEEQATYACHEIGSRPLLISGGGGSGKTTLLVHLLVEAYLNGERPLFVTYHPKLAEFCKQLISKVGGAKGAVECVKTMDEVITSLYQMRGLKPQSYLNHDEAKSIFTQLVKIESQREAAWAEFRGMWKGRTDIDRHIQLMRELSEIKESLSSNRVVDIEATKSGERIQLNPINSKGTKRSKNRRAQIKKSNVLKDRTPNKQLSDKDRKIRDEHREVERERKSSLKKIQDQLKHKERELKRIKVDYQVSAHKYGKDIRFLKDDALIKEIAPQYERDIEGKGGDRFGACIDLLTKTLAQTFAQRQESRWTCLLIDEAQDFATIEFQVLSLCVPDFYRWIVAGDQNQIVNPSGFRWERVKDVMWWMKHQKEQEQEERDHLNQPHLYSSDQGADLFNEIEPLSLHINYRNPKPIQDLATKILKLKEVHLAFDDLTWDQLQDELKIQLNPRDHLLEGKTKWQGRLRDSKDVIEVDVQKLVRSELKSSIHTLDQSKDESADSDILKEPTDHLTWADHEGWDPFTIQINDQNLFVDHLQVLLETVPGFCLIVFNEKEKIEIIDRLKRRLAKIKRLSQQHAQEVEGEVSFSHKAQMNEISEIGLELGTHRILTPIEVKGLEFDLVLTSNIPIPSHPTQGILDFEYNQMYVALTRSKGSLVMCWNEATVEERFRHQLTQEVTLGEWSVLERHKSRYQAKDQRDWAKKAEQYVLVGQLPIAAELYGFGGFNEKAARIYERLGELYKAYRYYEKADLPLDATRCKALDHEQKNQQQLACSLWETYGVEVGDWSGYWRCLKDTFPRDQRLPMIWMSWTQRCLNTLERVSHQRHIDAVQEAVERGHDPMLLLEGALLDDQRVEESSQVDDSSAEESSQVDDSSTRVDQDVIDETKDKSLIDILNQSLNQTLTESSSEAFSSSWRSGWEQHVNQFLSTSRLKIEKRHNTELKHESLEHYTQYDDPQHNTLEHNDAEQEERDTADEVEYAKNSRVGGVLIPEHFSALRDQLSSFQMIKHRKKTQKKRGRVITDQLVDQLKHDGRWWILSLLTPEENWRERRLYGRAARATREGTLYEKLQLFKKSPSITHILSPLNDWESEELFFESDQLVKEEHESQQVARQSDVEFLLGVMAYYRETQQTEQTQQTQARQTRSSKIYHHLVKKISSQLDHSKNLQSAVKSRASSTQAILQHWKEEINLVKRLDHSGFIDWERYVNKKTNIREWGGSLWRADAISGVTFSPVKGFYPPSDEHKSSPIYTWRDADLYWHDKIPKLLLLMSYLRSGQFSLRKKILVQFAHVWDGMIFDLSNAFHTYSIIDVCTRVDVKTLHKICATPQDQLLNVITEWSNILWSAAVDQSPTHQTLNQRAITTHIQEVMLSYLFALWSVGNALYLRGTWVDFINQKLKKAFALTGFGFTHLKAAHSQYVAETISPIMSLMFRRADREELKLKSLRQELSHLSKDLQAHKRSTDKATQVLSKHQEKLRSIEAQIEQRQKQDVTDQTSQAQIKQIKRDLKIESLESTDDPDDLNEKLKDHLLSERRLTASFSKQLEYAQLDLDKAKKKHSAADQIYKDLTQVIKKLKNSGKIIEWILCNCAVLTRSSPHIPKQVKDHLISRWYLPREWAKFIFDLGERDLLPLLPLLNEYRAGHKLQPFTPKDLRLEDRAPMLELHEELDSVDLMRSLSTQMRDRQSIPHSLIHLYPKIQGEVTLEQARSEFEHFTLPSPTHLLTFAVEQAYTPLVLELFENDYYFNQAYRSLITLPTLQAQEGDSRTKLARLRGEFDILSVTPRGEHLSWLITAHTLLADHYAPLLTVADPQWSVELLRQWRSNSSSIQSESTQSPPPFLVRGVREVLILWDYLSELERESAQITLRECAQLWIDTPSAEAITGLLNQDLESIQRAYDDGERWVLCSPLLLETLSKRSSSAHSSSEISRLPTQKESVKQSVEWIVRQSNWLSSQIDLLG